MNELSAAHRAAERRDYYVYVYFDLCGHPIYVGKGTGDRWKAISNRSEAFLALWEGSGRMLPVVKTHEGLSEQEAHQTEIALIAAIGRALDGGPLVNICKGGQGVSGLMFGKRFTDQHKARIAASRIGRGHCVESRIKMGRINKERRQQECRQLANRGLDTLTSFCRRISVAPGAKKSLINRWLPIRSDGLVDIREAVTWLLANGIKRRRGSLEWIEPFAGLKFAA